METASKSSSQRLVVFDVIHTPATTRTTSIPSCPPGSELDTLRKSKRTIQSRTETLVRQKKMLDDYSNGMKPIGDSGGVFSSTNLEDFLDLYGTRQNSLYDQTTELEAQLADVDQKIKNLEKAMYLEKEEQSSTSVSVILLAREEGDAELVVSYSTSIK